MDRQPAEPPPLKLDRAAYRAWAEAQPRGRFERVAGQVVAMAPERVGHARVKAAAWLALRQAIAAAGLPCEALPDGITVEVGEDNDYEPDAVVNCGERLDTNELAAPSPVIIVEVLSPGTRAVDTGLKLTDYFRLPSLQHYLILRPDRRQVIHHRRREDGTLDTRIHTAGRMTLDPPGIAIEIEALYAEA